MQTAWPLPATLLLRLGCGCVPSPLLASRSIRVAYAVDALAPLEPTHWWCVAIAVGSFIGHVFRTLGDDTWPAIVPLNAKLATRYAVGAGRAVGTSSHADRRCEDPARL